MNSPYNPYNSGASYPQQSYPAGQPVPRVSNSGWWSGVITCACGFSGIALGLLSAILSYNTYGALNVVPSTYLSLADVDAGPSPVFSLIIGILALLLSGGAVLMGILFGNRLASQGKPRGTMLSLGLACGLAGCLLGILVMIASGCTTASYCSIKEKISNSLPPASNLPSYVSSSIGG